MENKNDKENQKDVKKDFWDMLKNNVPAPFIILGVLYALGVFGGFSAYKTLVSNQSLTEDNRNTITDFFLRLAFVATIVTVAIFVVLIIIRIIKKRKSSSKQKSAEENYSIQKGPIDDTDDLPNGKIEAFIVSQDARSRDDKFNQINQNVKSTYWVLGVSLTSVVERETTLKAMAKKNVKIQICMMNPEIAVNDLCQKSVEENRCILAELIEDIKKESLDKGSIKGRLSCKKECEDLLKLHNVLIDVGHFNSYYDTATDYREKIAKSYKDLHSIQASITTDCGVGIFSLAASNAFIPMSMTVADAETSDGRMIVEFHLPFTHYKVLFEIVKNENEKLFEVFVDFYKKIWERAKS